MYLIHFELIFITYFKVRIQFILLHIDIQFSQHYFFKIQFFQLNCLGTSVKNYLTIYVRAYIWALYFFLLFYSSLVMLYLFQPYSKFTQLCLCMCVCVCILFQIIFHSRLLPDTDYSSLFHTVGPCCLSNLYTAVCIC